jgi:hypothetical protein
MGHGVKSVLSRAHLPAAHVLFVVVSLHWDAPLA